MSINCLVPYFVEEKLVKGVDVCYIVQKVPCQ